MIPLALSPIIMINCEQKLITGTSEMALVHATFMGLYWDSPGTFLTPPFGASQLEHVPNCTSLPSLIPTLIFNSDHFSVKFQHLRITVLITVFNQKY